MICSWCGNEITGESVTIEQGEIVFGNGDTEQAVIPALSNTFCCNGCAWAFEVQKHRLWGLQGKELREHLINDHGLVHPCGKPTGSMSYKCNMKFQKLKSEIGNFLSQTR